MGSETTQPVVRSHSTALLIVVAAVLLLPTLARADSNVRRATGKDGTVFTWDDDSVTRTTNVVRTSGVAGVLPNVAIVASAANDALAPWFLDPQTRLVASGAFGTVTVINANAVTPTVAELAAFDAVLVWSNLAFADADLLGDNLAQYVDDGGGVVTATFANSSPDVFDAPGGRWDTHAYEIVIPHGGTSTGAATLGTITQPAHPIMSGVAVFAGGTSSFRPTTTALYPSSQLIASWSDDSTLVAVRDDTVGARVDLGFYPPSDAVLAGFWDATTDGDLLMVNALLYAANRIPLIPGDTDGDNDSDMADYAVFDACFTGANVSPALAGCVTFDFDRDDDIDCDDWFALGHLWSDIQRMPTPMACRSIIPAASEWGLACLILLLLSAGTLLILRSPAGQV